jgi:membrane protease YdiL (CAAX protease family)
VNPIEEQQREDYVPLKMVAPLALDDRDFLPTTINPDAPHWNILSALGFVVISILAIVIFPNLAFICYALANAIPASEWKDLINNPNAILAAVLTTLPAHLLTILAGWILVTRNGRQPFFQTLGWRWKGFGFWACLFTTIGLYGVALLIAASFGEQENELTRILKSSRTVVYVVAFVATFTAPLVEEVVYRGVLYSAFRVKLSEPLAIFLVTLVFALIHVPQYLPNYGTIIVITILSLTLTLVRAKTGSLLPCVVIHTIFNGITSLLLIASPFLPKTLAPDEPTTGAILHLILLQ